MGANCLDFAKRRKGLSELKGDTIAERKMLEDAEVSLGVKAKRGERKSAHVRNTKIIKKYINGLIKALIDSYDEGGQNMSLKEATEKINAEWPNSPSAETMRRNWNDIKKTQKRDFVIIEDKTD